jgi:hypothetical protein
MSDEEIREPETARSMTGFTQNVARDAELADEIDEREPADEDDAEKRFEREATGEARYDATHQRP